MGGAGRTAILQYLAQLWHQRGQKLCVLGHGYGGHGAGLRPVAADCARDGDEAIALRRALPEEVPVWVGPRRAGIRQLAGPGRLLLVDGGLLDPHAPASAVLAALDATAPRSVLPAGPLRCALPVAARSADALWWHRVNEPHEALPDLPNDLGLCFQSAVRVVGLRLPGGRSVGAQWLAGRRVGLLTAVARPQSVLHTLRAAGAQIGAQRLKADHAPLYPEDLRGAGAADNLCWVCTEKDAPKLWPGAPVATLQITLTVRGPLEALRTYALRSRWTEGGG